MRPQKTRVIQCDTRERFFKPRCAPKKNVEEVRLTLDEFEALRLCDFEGAEQNQTAQKMKIHRSTVSRILASARRKVAQALVEIKPIRIRGGCCKSYKMKKREN